MKIRVATLVDAKLITRLHYDSKVAGILSHLPTWLLREYYYAPSLKSSNEESYVAEIENGDVIGHICISNKHSQYPRTSLRLKILVGAFLVIKSCAQPHLIQMLVNQIKSDSYLKRRGTLMHAKEIKIMVVHSSYTGEGVGTSLMKEILEKCDSKVGDIIVRTQNPLAVSFYEKFGFNLVEISERKKYRLWVGARKGE